MTTALISNDKFVTRRRYAENIRPEQKWISAGLEIPQSILLFNLFPVAQLQGALASFDKQLEKNKNRISNFDTDDLLQSFAKVVLAFLEINPSEIHSQITSLNSLVIKAETAKENVYIELFFDETTGWLNEAVVNIIKNQELQFNNSGPLDAMILAIKQYFGNEETDYITYLNQTSDAYALSGTTLTPADL